jgi:chromosome partitioning protein
VFQARIRRNIRLAEAPSFGQSIFDYAPDSHGAADYAALAAEVDQAAAVVREPVLRVA